MGSGDGAAPRVTEGRRFTAEDAEDAEDAESQTRELMMMRYLLSLLAVAGSGYGLAEQPTSSAIPEHGVLSQPVGPIEKAFLQEDAFPLTREMLSKPQRLDFDFSFPVERTNKSRQIDVPIHFDALTTVVAVS